MVQCRGQELANGTDVNGVDVRCKVVRWALV